MKSAYLAIALVGVGLGGLWYLGGGSNPPSLLARDGLNVASPVSHGNLTVFFLRGADQVDDQRVVTLQEALENGWAVIHETGTVSELAVENLMENHDLFLQSGDIIKGGKQDRMIASDMLVPAGSGKLPLASHCVEQGRWTGRSGEQVTHFSKSDNIAVGNALKLANLSRNQGEVWRNVSANQTALASNVGNPVTANASPTSLQLSLENEAVLRSAVDYEYALRQAGENAKGIVGVVFVINGQVTNAEVYGSNGLFKRVWPRLLKSASIEAVATKPAVASDKRVLTTNDVEAFLLEANRQENLGESAVVNASQFVSSQSQNTILRGVNTYTGQTNGYTGQLSFSQGTLNQPLPTIPPNASPDRIGNILVEGNTVTSDRVMLDPLVLSGHGQARQVNPPATPLPTGGVAGIAFQTSIAVPEPAPAPGQASVATIDNRQSLQTETRVPGHGNAVLHRSILKK